MPLKQSQDVRPVRMVLMEWISGFSMQSLIDRQKVRHFSPEERLCILAKAMEVECYINFHGVRHGDFAPRNIMLEPTDPTASGKGKTQHAQLALVIVIGAHARTTSFYGFPNHIVHDRQRSKVG
ncbi:hypothetical protein UVI_02063670 [Ustilaginoidea virens]|uniref:Protein kinase domain-containing protein n=1 Tax=Ustilaginoidea virens TaxID=1159556 RepID=A0A1B5L6J4_USTVR|nr:hypothetical protein UVI_02063670 [Ustilaginoidea virens]